ncbi:flavin-containing monooxygenase [Aquihabitans sp. McL0605]|uniref:flavin-containing monooxygenase n=1 Tax=Aquihabitans sp. McL0605 TaxID=3415671 RepID=UPI003CECEF5C
MPAATGSSGTAEHDVIVVGAGFSGLYALHKVRELGLRACILERADAVGGTWLYNRYPGARCDIESVEYSYSFSDEIQQEWTWTEVLPGQAEIEAYLNFVTDRLDLRRDIHFHTDVAAMTFDEPTSTWQLDTAAGESFTARFVIAATGILSTPLVPDIAGMGSFAGDALFSSRYPREGYDFTGKRVAVIGTGSTGVQATPVVAEQAEHLYLFQRSAAYTMPASPRAYEPGEFEGLQARYPEIRAAQHSSFIGAARLNAFSALLQAMERPPIKTATREEQLAAIEERGVNGALLWGDVLFDMEANRMATVLYGEAIARIVEDPVTAASLVPDHPFACKRPIIDDGYYETFNRPNVTLVDLRKGAIRSVTPTGIDTEQGAYEVDTILYATGFDAITGALSRLRVIGRDGIDLHETWTAGGPASYLGIQVAGFPNLFTIQGPGSPSASSNFVAALEQHVEWIGDCLAHLRAQGYRSIEATESAQMEWADHAASLVQGSILLEPSCNSWYNGANVPGKKRVYLGYTGGIPEYRRRCTEIAADGYAGFKVC